MNEKERLDELYAAAKGAIEFLRVRAVPNREGTALVIEFNPATAAPLNRFELAILTEMNRPERLADKEG